MSDPLEPLRSYFAGEKQAALWCFGVGVVALTVSVWLWRANGQFRAMAVPLLLVGLLQLAIGIGLFVRTDPQVATLQAELAAEPEVARERELARMERVDANFRIVVIAEAVLIVVGLGLAVLLRARPTAAAVGMGILLQAAVMLVFDLFAEHRAEVYTSWLRRQ